MLGFFIGACDSIDHSESNIFRGMYKMYKKTNILKSTNEPKYQVQHKPILFASGMIVASPAVLAHLDHCGINAQIYIERHIRGDWGDIPENDAQENLNSLGRGTRIFSSFLIEGQRVWIITEADRNSTCMIFPSEY